MLTSEDDYSELTEMLYLSSIPNMKDLIIEWMQTTISVYIPEKKVEQ